MSMGRVRITEKFQVTIPKDVRARVKIVPGEIVEVDAVDESTIIIRRMRINNPLSLLIGNKRIFNRAIKIEEVEEAAEEGESIH